MRIVAFLIGSIDESVYSSWHKVTSIRVHWGKRRDPRKAKPENLGFNQGPSY
jgi:hypothetical protein